MAILHGMTMRIRRPNMAYPKSKKELKVVCEEDVCLLEEEVSQTENSSAWLDIFCPQNSCEITSPTQLP
jgi:hypothetical protein